MRPRKPILVWARELEIAQDLAYVLRINRMFFSSACHTCQQFEDLLRRPGAPWEAVVLITNGNDGFTAIAARSKALAPCVPVLALSTTKKIPDPGLCVDRCIEASRDRSGAIEAIRMMSARKRGPRKRPVLAAAAPAPVRDEQRVRRSA